MLRALQNGGGHRVAAGLAGRGGRPHVGRVDADVRWLGARGQQRRGEDGEGGRSGSHVDGTPPRPRRFPGRRWPARGLSARAAPPAWVTRTPFRAGYAVPTDASRRRIGRRSLSTARPSSLSTDSGWNCTPANRRPAQRVHRAVGRVAGQLDRAVRRCPAGRASDTRGEARVEADPARRAEQVDVALQRPGTAPSRRCSRSPSSAGQHLVAEADRRAAARPAPSRRGQQRRAARAIFGSSAAVGSPGPGPTTTRSAPSRSSAASTATDGAPPGRAPAAGGRACR